MKILLAACNAKYIHSNPAVYDLKAFAGKYEDFIVLKEYTINQTKDEILRSVYLEKPDLVCVSCYIWNITFVRNLVCDLAKILPDTRFFAGGPEVSFDAEDFLRENPQFTGVMVGEGEETFLELTAHYVEGKSELKDIRGLVYRDAAGIHNTGVREMTDLSSIPFVYGNLQDFEHRIIYYESSRGCPFSCSYCLSSVDKKLRFRSLELVKKELQFFLDHQVSQVKFVDRTFNCRHKHAMEIWQYLAEHDNGITNFHFEISADLITEEELQLMAGMRPGLIQLEIGVQSTNPETIRAIRRTMDFEKLCETVARIRSFGNIHQHLDLIAGLPYEDYDSFRKSFLDVYGLRPQQLQLGFLKVLKGSYMKEMASGYRLIYQEQEPYEVLSTAWLGYDEILRLKTVESMVEVYYNSGQFQNTLEYLETCFADAFTMYEALGAFYERHGYEQISHSIIRRYDILLEFVRERPDISEERIVRGMMTDLYLRENLKSRPSFAPPQKAYEKEIREFRRRNSIPKTAHIEAVSEKRWLLFDYEHRDPLTNNAKMTEIRTDEV